MKSIEDGHDENSEPIFFDADEIKKICDTLNYMTGQLLAIQNKRYAYAKLEDLFFKYDGECWTEDGVTLLKYIHLAIANGNLTRFIPLKNVTRLMSYIGSTLSPYDPNFEQWYEENKNNLILLGKYE